MESINILATDKVETSGKKVSHDLENAGSELIRVSIALDEAT